MYYPDELVEEVRMKNDIVDVISQYVKLQKKGGNYFGLCPFHNEKSPSFSVSGAKQMYYCFGCGAGGNVLTFVMQYENYTFQEAITALAERAGVELPKQDTSQEARKQADLRTALIEINRLAANYYYYFLHQPQGKMALDYLKGRQLSDETMRRFGLGYSNKTSNDLYLYLKKKGYSDSILKESGLFSIEEKGAYDKFWNRVMFPIMDVNNRVIGFGGRVMGDGKPKYLNSPETRLFDKSRNLYGLNYARTSRRKYFLLCEGYMDVISMHQAGYTNAVASLGTAFTSQQAGILRRYVDQVILTYDSDEAGVKAALRAIPILKEAGISARVLDMKPYKDPDEFMKNLGPEEFEKRIEKARNSFLFEIDVLKKEYHMEDPQEKTAFYNRVAEKLLEFSEALERDNYIQAVAREFYIPYEDLRRLVNSMGNRASYVAAAGVSRGSSSRSQEKKTREDGLKQSQKLLLTWLIEKPELYAKIRGIITPEDFVDELAVKVAGMVFAQKEKGENNPAEILNHFINDEEQYQEVAALFHTNLAEGMTAEEQKKAFEEVVVRVKSNSVAAQGERLQPGDVAGLQKWLEASAALKNLKLYL
ncbi:MAG: DNA primase [bacterium]|nr:DNA primase [bacterium]